MQQALSIPGEPRAKATHSWIRPEELERTVEQLACKIKAGLSLSQALYALSVESKKSTLSAALRGVKASVDQHRPLGQALREYPEVFTPMSVDLLAAGDSPQRLLVQVQRLSSYLGQTHKMGRALQTATVRPARALALGLLAWASVLALGIPGFEAMARSLPMAEWSWATHLVLQVARMVRWFLPGALLATVLVFVAWRWFTLGDKGALRKSSLLFLAPVIGPLWRVKTINDFVRATGALAASGIPARLAVERGALATHSLVVRAAAAIALDKLTKGRDLPTALAEVNLIARSEINALQAGERRGNLGELMLKLAESSDAELLRQSVRVKNLAQIVAVLLIGLLAAATAVGFFGPAFFT